MDSRMLEILVCPICKGSLKPMRTNEVDELACQRDGLAFPIRDGIPVMLVEVARKFEPGTADS